MVQKQSQSMSMEKKLIIANLEQTKEFCEYCNREIRVTTIKPFGVTLYFKIICPCRKAKFEKIEEEMRHRQKKIRLEQLFRQSQLGERFKNASFDKFFYDGNSCDIYNCLKDYAFNFRSKYKKVSVVMYGKQVQEKRY
jgi:hypothetical protein